MKSISILLTDPDSINELLLLKSYRYLNKCRLKKIYFVGDKNFFKKIFYKYNNNQRFEFIHADCSNNWTVYLKKIIKISTELFNNKKISYVINLPLNKKKFFKNQYNGFTEFFSKTLDNKKDENMLLFNKNFSVCPLTTHIEIKKVDSQINKNKLVKTIKNLSYFYETTIKKKIKIVVLGLNPHASKDLPNNNKDRKVISKVIKRLKGKVDIEGPLSADTAFYKTNNKVYVGMYHDQVLIPFKMKNKFDGLNITIGKKIIRLSPDHGTGKELIKKPHLINNYSFLSCIKFCEKY
ncbi:4-hydroxythreonine-4-phosphate dehydrogenase PdxA [Pelagibacteraceae bacterium]|nr:4-hydroxythreonine-4-phosphate dehydrogenase PdxA [Pelagibacteraceae bacterium]